MPVLVPKYVEKNMNVQKWGDGIGGFERSEEEMPPKDDEDENTGASRKPRLIVTIKIPLKGKKSGPGKSSRK